MTQYVGFRRAMDSRIKEVKAKSIGVNLKKEGEGSNG